ncbi:armadillo-type protein [Gymnopilus junonius]|uniref:Armadillo-type protein n=1 Tax=Gymnopilus junonius TaxID=109634 RepID=A0A9P5TN69_GYMJU|nr:armadillo-type protein [Gymnopilus junonius]
MQSILRWAIENSDNQPGAAPSQGQGEQRNLKDLDPGIIDAILGKPDSEQMKEDMTVAVDPTRSEDDRINALDHLEMLIESIDNANDLEKLKLWEPLHSILTAQSTTQDIKTQGLWVVGTAVQNNPSAQDAYLFHNPLPTLLSFLDPSSSNSSAIRAKAIYALSGLLRHNVPALEQLNNPDVDGWTKLRNALQDPSISVRRKSVFLLSALLIPNEPSPTTSVPVDILRITDSPSSGELSTATAVTSAPTSTNILTPDQRPTPSSGELIYANSHSAQLKDPSRSNTSPLALQALQEHGILDAVISTITIPLPHGDDGENTEADDDFEEKAIHLLYTYVVTLKGELSQTQKEKIRKLEENEKQKMGESKLAEKWNFSKEEYDELVRKVA